MLELSEHTPEKAKNVPSDKHALMATAREAIMSINVLHVTMKPSFHRSYDCGCRPLYIGVAEAELGSLR